MTSAQPSGTQLSMILAIAENICLCSKKTHWQWTPHQIQFTMKFGAQ